MTRTPLPTTWNDSDPDPTRCRRCGRDVDDARLCEACFETVERRVVRR